MFFKTLFDKGALPVLERMSHFTEARHSLLLNDIANIETPRYKRKDLSVEAFQNQLKSSIKERSREHRRIFRLQNTREVSERNGNMRTNAREVGNDSILRYDENNTSVEKAMTRLAKNNMNHKMFSSLLKKKYNGLSQAIRGAL